MVGPPYTCVVLRERPPLRIGGRDGQSDEVRGVRLDADQAGPRRTRHMVLVGAVAVYHARLAREDARPRILLPDRRDGDGLRHTLLLGGPHDIPGAGEHRGGAVPYGVPARP